MRKRVELPIGSVVVLEGGNVPVCIIGKGFTNNETEKTFDFAGVIYPRGYLGPDRIYFFNKEDIVKIYSTGLLTDVSKRDWKIENGRCFQGLLPVGSVVRLKGGDKPVCIVGLGQVTDAKPGEIFDYGAVLFPEGLLSLDGLYMFNNNQIEEILHVGFMYDEQMQFEDEYIGILIQAREQNTVSFKGE